MIKPWSLNSVFIWNLVRYLLLWLILILLVPILEGLHKNYWGTRKKCENKNLRQLLFCYNFLKYTGREGLRFCMARKSVLRQSRIVNIFFQNLFKFESRLRKSFHLLKITRNCTKKLVNTCWTSSLVFSSHIFVV